MAILPLIMTPQGLQPTAPIDLRNRLISLVSASNPDYTANLPGSLIEDISSTDTYALVVSDSFLVDLVNSITPFGANAFLLSQLGQIYGVDKQPITNTSVFVVFTGPPGYVIAQGFTVGDGTYQYVCQNGGICGTDGQSLPMYAISPTPGAWPVLPGTVNQMITSVPSNINLSVINPVDGFPSTSGEPISVFRERVFTAGLAASTGMARYLKTLCGNIPGVQDRLIAVQQRGDKYVVLVGGGDPYQVANAIWQADFYTPGLAGAVISISGIQNTNPLLITTRDKHNLMTGDIETFSGIVGFPFINDQTFPVTVIDPYRITIPIDGTGWGVYQYGGTIEPNPINNLVTISDYPDKFVIPYVIPAQELVNIVLTWTTDSINYVSVTAMAQAAVPVIVDYINSLPCGTTPINLNVLTSLFLDAVKDILQGELIIDVDYDVSIDDVGVSVVPGTQVIYGDPNSYFYTENSRVQVIEG